MTIVDCISDLHGHYPHLEGGDLLIVAGDLTRNDEIEQYLEFFRWFQQQKYTKKVLIAGNHDNKLVGPWPGGAKGPFREDKTFYDFDYLCDSGTHFIHTWSDERNILTKKCFKIWGSPWTKTFEGMNPKCKAFTLDTEEELAEKWALIPKDTDILITHSPPYDILDEVDSQEHCTSYHVGSKSLLQRVCEIKPRLHVFGHVHEGYGEFKIRNWKELRIEDAGITQHIKDSNFVNASYVNEHYEPVNKPIRVIL